jgi:transmembrane 9 superfamily member 3
MMVIFLCGLVGLILLRTLRNDFSRYSVDENDMELEHVVDESAWKQVHNDVFRSPTFLVMFSTLIGTGSQLFVLAFCVIVFTIVGDFYDDRGSIMTTFLVCYSATSFIAGYSGACFYKRAGGRKWKRVLLLTMFFLPGITFSISSMLNFIAVAYGSMASLSITTILMVVAIWLCISCPLVLAGTIVGRSTAVSNDHPCRVNKTRRPIPYQRWYSTPLFLILFSGLLPFGSIFIEVYFIFTSFWNYKFYYVYGFMLLVYLILIVVTVCVSIVATYLLLNSEDYRWQWTSFLSGASTALYVYIYAIYYFFTKTRMTGIMQTSFYFAYMGMFCLCVFLICGTIAFMGTNIFVRRIYNYIKSD